MDEKDDCNATPLKMYQVNFRGFKFPLKAQGVRIELTKDKRVTGIVPSNN